MKPRHSTRYAQFLVKLRRARLDAELTQWEAGQALGKSQTYVSKCETGERRVDFVEAEIFAELYGKTVSYFFTGKSN